MRPSDVFVLFRYFHGRARWFSFVGDERGNFTSHALLVPATIARDLECVEPTHRLRRPPLQAQVRPVSTELVDFLFEALQFRGPSIGRG